LEKLIDRVNKNDLQKIFGPFKSSDSVFAAPSEGYHKNVSELYERILSIAEQHSPGIIFSNWSNSMKSYWEAVKEEDFSTRFKDINEFNSFLDRGRKISKIKETLEKAFRYHNFFLI